MRLFLLISLGLELALAKDNLHSEFQNVAALDESQKVKLFWSVNFEEKKIKFAVEAETEGWIGVGISSGQGKMDGADIVIGWVKDGKHYFSDRHASGHWMPKKDVSQNYQLISLTEDNGKTTMIFERMFDTCDLNDNKITEGTTKLIYAYHHDDPASENDIPQHETRGARSVMLLNTHDKLPSLPQNLQYFDIVANKTNVPSSDTTYWCTAYEIPTFPGKRHVVKIDPLIQEGNEGLAHHIIIYECSDDFPRSNLSYQGQCYSSNMPPIQACAGKTVIYGWAIGGQAFYYPEHVGFALGEEDSPKFVILEIHYDNPDRRSDFVDSSGLRFYYTDQLRKYDAGAIFAGWTSYHSLTIPPGQAEWESSGYCSSHCTKEGLKNSPLTGGGVYIFATLLHSHVVGKSISVQHIRNGTELPEIARDDHYDFNFQEYQVTRKEIEVLPGDDIVTTCKYDTTGRNTTTLGGLSTREEMCLSYLMYYPKRNLTTCVSSDHGGWENFHNKYINDQTKFSPNYWNASMVEYLKNAYKKSKEVNIYCSGRASNNLPGLFHKKKEKAIITKPLLPEEDSCKTVNSAEKTVSSFLCLLLLLTCFSL